MSSLKILVVALALAAVFGLIVFVLPHGVDKAPAHSEPFIEVVLKNVSSETIQFQYGVVHAGDVTFGDVAARIASDPLWEELTSGAEATISAPDEATGLMVIYRPNGLDTYGTRMFYPSGTTAMTFMSDVDIQTVRARTEAEKSASGSAQAAPAQGRTLAELIEYAGTQEFVDRLSRNSPLMRITEEALGSAEAATAVVTPHKQE